MRMIDQQESPLKCQQNELTNLALALKALAVMTRYNQVLICILLVLEVCLIVLAFFSRVCVVLCNAVRRGFGLHTDTIQNIRIHGVKVRAVDAASFLVT
jgi:hypothetical protein